MNLKRFFLFECMIIVFFPINIFAKSKSCDPGEFLFSYYCTDCPKGCFCSGGDLYSLDPDYNLSKDDLKKYCAGTLSECYTGNSKFTEDKTEYPSWSWGDCGRQDAAKIYKCPTGFTSEEKQKTKSACYFKSDSGDTVYWTVRSCEAGTYLPAKSGSCKSCKTGTNNYCPGLTDAYPSTTKDQGISTCPDGKKPNMARTACEDDGISCIAGTYLPANSSTCAACPDGFYCPQGTWQPQPIDQGKNRCTGSTVPNEERTECIQGAITVSEGYYLPANTTEPVPCKGAKSYCPGGTFDKASKDQGIFDCPKGGRANKNKTACTITIIKNHMKECWTDSGDPDKYKTCVLTKRYYK